MLARTEQEDDVSNAMHVGTLGYGSLGDCHSRTCDRRGKRIYVGVRYFSFPTWKQHHGPQISELTKRRRMAWVEAVGRESITFDSISQHMFVCSRHFHYGKPAYEMLECDPDWVPSLHMGHSEKSTDTKRFNQRKKRKKSLMGNNAAFAPLDLDDQRSDMVEDVPQDDALQMDEVGLNTVKQQECDFCSCSNAELNRLLEENRMLKKELSQQKMDEDFFKADDKKVEYYTGLPSFPVLMGVLAHLDPYLPQASQNLSPFQTLVSTLMQLKLNLPVQHIAFLFSVDRKTMTTTFRDTIDVMFIRLKPLVHWPERYVLLATLPHQFVEAFGEHVSIIVDCFEMNIEGAVSFKAGSHTFSRCKHKDTLKYLIGFTPMGAIAFVSQGWAGGVSDKHVTENSGLLNQLLPGDLVLAGRGFDIKDSAGLMCAEVKSPAVTGESNQLDVKYVEGTHHTAYIKDHVEKIIGTIHAKSSILSRTLPVSMVLPCPDEDLSFFDKILTVCCTVTNMCPSVVMPWLKP
nr:uncharacterized protein LOC129444673 isoform X2 [Misgurnus anguillicaudatus]